MSLKDSPFFEALMSYLPTALVGAREVRIVYQFIAQESTKPKVSYCPDYLEARASLAASDSAVFCWGSLHTVI